MKTAFKPIPWIGALVASVLLDIGAAADQPGQFETVYQLVRTNLIGLDAERFEREALRGLLRRMEGRVQVVKPGKSKSAAPGGLLAEPAKVFEGRYAYLRVRSVESGLADSIRTGLRDVTPAGGTLGLMVDLRFAAGDDYDAAVRVVNEFVGRDGTQLMVGERHLRTTLNSNVITGPVAILVNAETGGAAEALAAMFRRNDVGLLIGSKTAGQTKVFTEFPLADGSQLRVATGEVLAGDGLALSSSGLTPDIAVDVDPGAERKFFGDAYALPKGRNQRRGLINEAALVRQLELQLHPDAQLPTVAEKVSAGREVFDPVLGRALDLLKGLNLLGPAK